MALEGSWFFGYAPASAATKPTLDSELPGEAGEVARNQSAGLPPSGQSQLITPLPLLGVDARQAAETRLRERQTSNAQAQGGNVTQDSKHQRSGRRARSGSSQTQPSRKPPQPWVSTVPRRHAAKWADSVLPLSPRLKSQYEAGHSRTASRIPSLSLASKLGAKRLPPKVVMSSDKATSPRGWMGHRLRTSAIENVASAAASTLMPTRLPPRPLPPPRPAVIGSSSSSDVAHSRSPQAPDAADSAAEVARGPDHGQTHQGRGAAARSREDPARRREREHRRQRQLARERERAREAEVRWDSSVMRYVPDTLRGAKPVTNEPWARDAVVYASKTGSFEDVMNDEPEVCDQPHPSCSALAHHDRPRLGYAP